MDEPMDDGQMDYEWVTVGEWMTDGQTDGG